MSSNILFWSGLFVVERDVWVTSHGELPTPLVAAILGHESAFDMIVHFHRNTKTVLKNDHVLFALAQVLTLFQPGDGQQVDHQTVNAIHDKYMILLKHYLQSLYSYHHANVYFKAIMEIVADLKQLGKLCLCFMSDFYDLCPQLMRELTTYSPEEKVKQEHKERRTVLRIR
jgi:hypothetical protein